MSKKKNTLNVLNDFLKSSASGTAVAQDDYLNAKPHTIVEVDTIHQSQSPGVENLSISAIVDEIMALGAKNHEDARFPLLRIIKETISKKGAVNSSDLMLLNTAIYLEHTEKMGKSFREMMKDAGA